MLEKVENLLSARQLEFERTEEDTIATGFSTQLPDDTTQGFPLFVQWIEDSYGDNYVRFNVVPFIDQPYDGYPADLYLIMGMVNHDLPQLKLAFDSDGDLELIFDVPADKLDGAQFDLVLQLLADYASTYYPELSRLVGENT